MLPTILAATIAFISTNIDDVLVLMLFFTRAENPSAVRRIVEGQYLGVGVLTAFSLLGSRALQLVPQQYISLLGLIPIALGVREFVSWRIHRDDDFPESVTHDSPLLSVALVTIANGADNIGVYVPLFACYSAAQMLAAAIVFAAMTAVWCFLGLRLASLPALKNAINKYKPVIVPVVFICLGLSILLE